MSIGRNEPCPCGSGKKYKKCCIRADIAKRQEESAEEVALDDEFAESDGASPIAWNTCM